MADISSIPTRQEVNRIIRSFRSPSLSRVFTRLEEVEQLLGRIVDDVRDAIHEEDLDAALEARLEKADQLLGPREAPDA